MGKMVVLRDKNACLKLLMIKFSYNDKILNTRPEPPFFLTIFRKQNWMKMGGNPKNSQEDQHKNFKYESEKNHQHYKR